MASSVATPTPLTAEQCRVQANPGDLLIQVPSSGGVSVVNHFNIYETLTGGPVCTRKETHLMSTERVGKLLAGVEPAESADNTSGWIDLLGVSTPGLAVKVQKGQTTMVVTFPAREKTLRQNQSNTLGNNPDGTARVITFPVMLPPSTWVLRFGRDGKLRHANLFLSDTKVMSTSDNTPTRVFPLGNCYGSHGGICWGNVGIGTLRVEDPLAVDNLFFATPFNQDLMWLTEITGPVTAGLAMTWSRVENWMRWLAENPADHGKQLAYVGPTLPFARRLVTIAAGGE